ncbi:hypothetical protein OS175_10735 [Marinicella sp. S1101]|uniref:hypothetical protein n=1 Tax=Marinicella marina TaxID=2996016 RepID=UPI002260DB56|nr:hypothetical protein [Marinicella marina]MCX7554357.1 hypothetical protein [Marinicella marina]MDJ1138652.1 hypothetical protein [Marinicella marina]
MSKQDLSQLSDDELIKHAEIMKKTKRYDTFIMGFLVGVALFSTIKNGFGLLTFLPLIYPPIAARNMAQRKLVNALMDERGLTLQ